MASHTGCVVLSAAHHPDPAVCRPGVCASSCRVLHELGEHRQTMIAAGRPHAAVYAMPQEPQAAQPAAAAAGDAGAAVGAAAAVADNMLAMMDVAVGVNPGGALPQAAGLGMDDDEEDEAAAAGGQVVVDPQDTEAFQAWLRDNPPFQQLQLLAEPVPPTAETPETLQAVRVPIMALAHRLVPGVGGRLVPDREGLPVLRPIVPLFLAVPPPLEPGSDKRYPLMFLSRTNALWFQVCEAKSRSDYICGDQGHGPVWGPDCLHVV